MLNLKGRCLKEITVDLLLEEPLAIDDAKAYLAYLIKNILKTKIVTTSVNILKPGYDLAVTIKESIVYLGYWPEYNYVHLILSSCKNFNENSVREYLEKNMTGLTHIKMITRYDLPIKKLIKNFSCFNY